MQKRKRKIHMLLIGTLLAIFIIFVNSTLGSMGGEKGKGEESREFAALEQALMKIEGIGEVLIYPITINKRSQAHYPVIFRVAPHLEERTRSKGS